MSSFQIRQTKIVELKSAKSILTELHSVTEHVALVFEEIFSSDLFRGVCGTVGSYRRPSKMQNLRGTNYNKFLCERLKVEGEYPSP